MLEAIRKIVPKHRPPAKIDRDKQTDGHTDRQTDRQTETQKQTDRHRMADRQVVLRSQAGLGGVETFR